mmetsp:Transcript_39555/g.92421  ORF Transcript_39555/g.92421 Transcript_39555/m.92421 type:complete len:128 (-) Transcript_39555:142-525(-)
MWFGKWEDFEQMCIGGGERRRQEEERLGRWREDQGGQIAALVRPDGFKPPVTSDIHVLPHTSLLLITFAETPQYLPLPPVRFPNFDHDVSLSSGLSLGTTHNLFHGHPCSKTPLIDAKKFKTIYICL